MQSPLFFLVPIAALASLAGAWLLFRRTMAENEGNAAMIRIAAHVRAGAMAYLRQQYRVVALFFVAIAILLAILAYGMGIQNHWVPFAFLTSGFFSGLAGFFGMRTATAAASRVAEAARHSLDRGLRVAFRSGAVLGLTVVGLALLDISIWFVVLGIFVEATGEATKMALITTTMLTFGMGASLQALFARVGGGIFTKAADVGADLVGKVESGIPEDDPRNPATIADNVGDNVGDVAGMGADLYESYYGSILATAALGAAAFGLLGDPSLQYRAAIAPMVIAASGALFSLIGVFFVRVRSGASQRQLMAALERGIYLNAALVAAAAYPLLRALELPNAGGIWGALVAGLATGIVIGKATEIATSHEYGPTRRIADAAETGPATVIIAGMGSGMLSTVVPALAVVIGTSLAYGLASGDWTFSSGSMSLGLYGIGFAAVGMLSTLGLTLATDAYGPIADNAGGNAEMAHLGPEVRERTDALDALGNTTAATGKGFAIGSAALTALALLAAYVEQIKISLLRVGQTELSLGSGEVVSVATASLEQFMEHFHVTLMNPKVLLGMLIGSVMAFLFCGLTIHAVGRAAGRMVEEVRRQFREIPGILAGKAEPDYARCVAISTQGAQREMALPAVLAVAAPIVTGLIFGVAGVFGLLAGSLVTGFSLAVFMANSGGAWDNAKKYIEAGHHGGKGSAAHRAAVIGDTVGDPFKDTSGPSLNILIKLMSIVAIVTAGLNVAFTLF
jgi:K(+)-stimulated pyrophosphate-energized sodium pump